MDLFNIEPLTLSVFITDQKLKLPRYQRKDTWKSNQSFDLCISVFQGYPVGVCIVNRFSDVSWLLDGRQRRTALTKLYNNPVEVYDWAKSYCKFKSTDGETEVREKFWGKVNTYLDVDKSEITLFSQQGAESDFDNVDFDDQEEIIEDKQITSHSNSLNGLLNLILMVHQKKNGTNEWYKAFDFSKFIRQQSLKYYPMVNGTQQFQPDLLCSFIRESGPSIMGKDGSYNKDAFIEYCENNWVFKGAEDDDSIKKGFEKYVAEHWVRIQASYMAIINVKNVLEAARIGVIYLSNVATRDAQNIFSRINSGGTQLTAAELLSAKPYWNISVGNVDPNTKTAISTLYNNLGVQTEEKIVRWDIPATLVSQIDKKGLFFTSTNNSKDTAVNVAEIALGFKIVSSQFAGGMSKVCLDSLETKEKLDWSDGLTEFSYYLRQMVEVIETGIKEFAQLRDIWHTNICDLLGFAPALELLVGSFKVYEEMEYPAANTADGKAFLSGVKNHFDRLIFERASGAWKGSGDSRMAKGLAEYKLRRNGITKSEHQAWNEFIAGAAIGIIHNQPTKLEALKPLLFYANVLQYDSVWPKVNEKFDVDHIIPQSFFNANSNADSTQKEAIGNLALLPASLNRSKKDKWITEVIADQDAVCQFEGIDAKYRDNSNPHSMLFDVIVERGENFKEIFDQYRKNWLLTT